MKKLKGIIFTVISIVIIGGICAGGYFLYEDSYYFSTEDAKIAANVISITPEVTGKVLSWDVKEGDYIKAGQILGRQDVSSLISSSAVNAQALASSADAIAAKSNIKTPIDGKVVQCGVVNGQVISPGMEIAQIEDTSNIYITANVEETSILKIKPGQQVDITIDAYPGKHFTGYVGNIGQATQSAFSSYPSLNTSGTFSKVTQLIPVKITIANSENLELMPGMNAVVKIHVK